MILGAILTFILILLAIIGLFWNFFGIPLGIVLAILKKNKKITLSRKQILLITFGGLGLLVSALVIFFILSIVLGLFGTQPANLTLPDINTTSGS